MNYPEYVHKITNRLEESGESAYIVGGSVRDMLLGSVPHDYDVATSALPEKTAEIFRDMHVIETGIKHGTVTVVCDGHPVEITTYRIDGSYTDSRHPDAVSFTSDIASDLARRDFTVNAMAYNDTHGLVDLYGGVSDIEAKVIRTVGSPSLRFAEDALRIMRAFRFSAQLGFTVEPQTLLGCRQMSRGLANIARERIGAELIKLVCSPSPENALGLMQSADVSSYVFGDYLPTEKIISNIGKMPRDDYSRLGFLLCDADEDTARCILHSLRCSGKQITGAMAVRRGSAMRVVCDKDARRLLADTGIYATAAARASELLGNSSLGAYDITVKQQSTPHSLRDLKINGKALASLGVRGKQIGIILEHLLSLVIDDPSLNDAQTLTDISKRLIKEADND